MQRQLLAFVTAGWCVRPLLLGNQSAAADRPQRTSFAAGLMRMPVRFRGYEGASETMLYRAAAAHVASHLAFGCPRLPIGRLKPLQVALISLMEDARVEHCAMRELPGLRSMWGPFHTAGPSEVQTATGLMARLARALFDPDYKDDSRWVQKGRALFAEAIAQADDASMSRRIGGLLGNDLGQMRVQFNARAYVVEPPYRDDNSGLWKPNEETASAEDADALPLPIQPEVSTSSGVGRQEAPSTSEPDQTQTAGLVHPVLVESALGVPVARHPEWDYVLGGFRPEWTTIVEYEPESGDAGAIDVMLQRNDALLGRVCALIRSAKVGRTSRLRRQNEGEQLDFDAALSAVIDYRRGVAPDPRVYMRHERRRRDLSALLLLDVSRSTRDRIAYLGCSVLQIEIEAAAVLAQAMADLGDPFAIRAFSSDGRHDVRFLRIKDFGHPYDIAARRRLAGLNAQFSTRIGAAVRQSAAELIDAPSYRRLLLVITDGEPSDIDVVDSRYLVEDARMAVHGLAQTGIDAFCVVLGGGAGEPMSRIFGRRRVLHVDRLERLPERLATLYFRLTM